MPEQLYLAANLAQSSLFFGHLQIVYEDAGGTLLETESTSPGFPYFWGDWVYPAFGARHDDSGNTPGYGDPDDYAIVSLDLRPGQAAHFVWELLGQVHHALSTGGFGIDYDIDQNSNSYVASLLSVVGIDLSDYLDAVTPPSVTSFPGAGTNILFGAKTDGLFSGSDTPIALTLAGTAGDDYIATGIGDDQLGGAAGNDLIRSGAGDDVLRGGGGRDRLLAGDDDDLVKGQGGHDHLAGGRGNDTLIGQGGHDHIYGGQGNDLLSGRNMNDTLSGGEGDDTLLGGGGEDQFVFDGGADVIRDFQDGIDQIVVAQALVGDAIGAQQVIEDVGRVDGNDVVLDFGSDELRIKNIADLAMIADDLIVA